MSVEVITWDQEEDEKAVNFGIMFLSIFESYTLTFMPSLPHCYYSFMLCRLTMLFIKRRAVKILSQ